MLASLRRFEKIRRQFGLYWLSYRLVYAAKIRLGLIKHRMPPCNWSDRPFGSFLKDQGLRDESQYLDYRNQAAPSFFFKPGDRSAYRNILTAWDNKSEHNPLKQSIALGQGEFTYFGHTKLQIGFLPDWFFNPFTHQRHVLKQHWSQIPDFGVGDIKVIWELSRFGFVYTLVRAYWRSGDERFAEIFWKLVEDWQLQNPPQIGPNWKCGQEISFRVMALCFGLYGFLQAEITNASCVTSLARMIAVSGERVEANINYALSQQNNHGISEALGLWTIGLLFPEFKAAQHWKELGQSILEKLAHSLIYDDGSFAQHSVNYHRLMLHDYLWAVRLGDLNGQSLSSETKERIGKACEFLFQLLDERTGSPPLYGQNDGALILPLNNCGYHDFRPVVQAIQYLTMGTRCFANGPWDEDLLWLFGEEALKASVISLKKKDLAAKEGGYYTLHGKESFVFIRCGQFKHRPSQADMLHIDLWWKGQNIAVDPGTYSYNAPQPWDNPLAHTACHNTVSVDSQDQMERAGKFLWLPWLKGKVNCICRSSAGHLVYWEGSHDGYGKLRPSVDYHRGILKLGEDFWLVVDILDSAGYHNYGLHWLFLNVPFKWDREIRKLYIDTEAGFYYVQIGSMNRHLSCSLVQGDEGSPRGWRAPYYYYKEPTLSIDSVVRAANVTFWTILSPNPAKVSNEEDHIIIQTESWRGNVYLRDPRSGSRHNKVINSVYISGVYEDELKIT